MTEIYIYHHLGLGDHIICNAIVRNYAKLFNKAYLFVKPHNYESVKFMYRDLDHLELIQCDDNGAREIIKNKQNVLRVGFENLNPNIKFIESFYSCIGMNYDRYWKDFYVERDFEKEIEFFKSFKIDGEFIFLQEGGSAGKSIINRNLIRGDLPIIKAELGLTKNVFDYCYIIENAKEIHCVDSSFLFLIDLIKTNGKLFTHRYTKHLDEYEIPILKKDWNILL